MHCSGSTVARWPAEISMIYIYPEIFLFGYNNLFRRCCVARPSQLGHIKRVILGGRWFVSIQCHYRTCMASYNESHSFYVPSNGKLPHENESHSRSDRTPTRRFGLRRLTLIFFRPPCWGLPLVEVTSPLSIKLSESRPCGNLHEST